MGPALCVSQKYVVKVTYYWMAEEFPEEKTRRKTSAEEVRSTGNS